MRSLVLMVLTASALFALTNTLIKFKLEDQFGRAYTDRQFRGHLTLMIGSDKDGAKFNDKWGRAIRKRLSKIKNAPAVKSLPVADMSSAPSFASFMIKRFFPRDKAKWVLLDWDGIFAKAYDFKKRYSNIVLFDQKGKVVLKKHAKKVNQVWLGEIEEALRKQK